MPHLTLDELTISGHCSNLCCSAEDLISLVRNKKKGFTLICNAKYEDGVKAMLACPSSVFLFKSTYFSLISFEDAINAIYEPMKTIYVKSFDPLERVYNKKGYKLALSSDNTPTFKLAL